MLKSSEKHTPPPYDAAYGHLVDDEDDELIAMQRARRNRRILKYSGYALLCLLVVLTCSLLGYFLAPRTPVVALHAINSPESASSSKFKLQGTKMQFHVDLIYRVQNDNFFDMSISDISTAVFWPDTKFALGGGRLSDIRIPARRTVQISMPVAMKYDVKRGPPPILLGMVESCGLHDTGIGEINLEVEVQADVHTKMKQTAIQSGRQSISIKCPVRRMATLQVDDGTSGNLGDIPSQRMSFIDLTVDDGDHSVAENPLVMQIPTTPQRLGHSSDSDVYEVSDITPTGPVRFQMSSQPPGRKRKRASSQELPEDNAVTSANAMQPAVPEQSALSSSDVIEVRDSPVIDQGTPMDVDEVAETHMQTATNAAYSEQLIHQHTHSNQNGQQQVIAPSSYQPHVSRYTNGSFPAQQAPLSAHPHTAASLPTPHPYIARGSALHSQPPLQPVASTSNATRGSSQRMRMIGQLQAVAVISTGSKHYREGTATQIPTMLRNREGTTVEVDLYDQAGGIIGTLEQSVTKTIYSLQTSGHIKVAGMTHGPLQGRFISPIALSFYADEELALGIMKVLEESGLFLNQTGADAQQTIQDLGTTSNAVTQGINYTSRRTVHTADGFNSLRENSDKGLPSVFSEMNFTGSTYGQGGSGTGVEWKMIKERYRELELPASMRLVEKPPEPDDAKTRLANIKSTFITLLDLPETEAPPLITTPLKRHQKQALHFMVHRETDGIDVEDAHYVDIEDEIAFPKLWKPSGGRSIDPSRQEYVHTLVDVHCIGKPKALLGGILADDMGLGKTLTTISLIAMMPPKRKPAERVKFAEASNSAEHTAMTPKPFKAPKRRKKRVRKIKKAARIARNPASKSRSQVTSILDDSDSFTEVRPAKRRRCSGAKSIQDITVQSDSDYLTDDPLSVPAGRSRQPIGKSERLSSSESSDSDSKPLQVKADSNSQDGSSDNGESSSEEDIGSVERPMTPPPEFDNLPIRNKVKCEKRFADNYRGRYAGKTLIVCPLSTMGNWEEQVQTHVKPRGLSVYAFHGGSRIRDPRRLCHYDIVLTTFNVLQSEYRRETRQLLLSEEEGALIPRAPASSSEEESCTKVYQVPPNPYVSPIQAIHWHRVVLDEAHSIKERRTLSSLAAHALHADRRWCLTGTPIQNRLDDLYSLLRFLHATPLDNWKIWLSYIAGPFHENVNELSRANGQFEEGNIGANRVQRLMQSICLRRMKQQVDTRTNCKMIELPPKYEKVRWLDLADSERRLYQMAEDVARSKFASMTHSGTVLQNYMSILKIILRLRQLCTHPRLWSANKWSESQALSADNAIAERSTHQQQPAQRPRTSQSESNAELSGTIVSITSDCSEQPVKFEDAKSESIANGSEPTAKIEVEADTSEVKDVKTRIGSPGHVAQYQKWDSVVQAQGPLAKCEFCNENAIPGPLLQFSDAFSPTDYPGPAVTRCLHFVCRQCQVVLCGVAPANPQEEAEACAASLPLTECMLCNELLGPGDALRLSAQHIQQSLTNTSVSSVPQPQPPPPEERSYDELDRMCSEHTTSTKIRALMSDIAKIRKRAWITDHVFGVDQNHPDVVRRRAELMSSPNLREKCVVFSQWTSMLDLIEPLLREQKVRFARLDGAMSRPRRESNLRRFERDPDVEILLLSLRAGGVGLNLAHASHVFLMDAFWNPSVENQAIDRIHRLGQKNPITVTRYFIRNSIEEKIMQLQIRKARIADISLMDSNRRPGTVSTGSAAGETDEMLAITTGTHSRQQRLDDLNLLLG
ncbi:hypothetical protein IWW42_003029 [Coemansia sp. RSA 1085]|nr:hypothetical protein IWW42_003029 [Coemansia sp. RSA 1085]